MQTNKTTKKYLNNLTGNKIIGITVNTDNTTLGNRVRSARLARGLTQQELADMSGTTQDTITKIERDIIKKPREIEAIAKALDVSPAWQQFGVEEIDQLDQDSLELALAYNQLPEDQKIAIKATIKELSKKSQK